MVYCNAIWCDNLIQDLPHVFMLCIMAINIFWIWILNLNIDQFFRTPRYQRPWPIYNNKRCWCVIQSQRSKHTLFHTQSKPNDETLHAPHSLTPSDQLSNNIIKVSTFPWGTKGLPIMMSLCCQMRNLNPLYDSYSKCDVINRGFNVYNTRWVKIALPRLIPTREVDNIHLIIIMLGTNDSHMRPLLWRHNRRDSVSNHQTHHCVLNRLFRRRSKKTFFLWRFLWSAPIQTVE